MSVTEPRVLSAAVETVSFTCAECGVDGGVCSGPHSLTTPNSARNLPFATSTTALQRSSKCSPIMQLSWMCKYVSFSIVSLTIYLSRINASSPVTGAIHNALLCSSAKGATSDPHSKLQRTSNMANPVYTSAQSMYSPVVYTCTYPERLT